MINGFFLVQGSSCRGMFLWSLLKWRLLGTVRMTWIKNIHFQPNKKIVLCILVQPRIRSAHRLVSPRSLSASVAFWTWAKVKTTPPPQTSQPPFSRHASKKLHKHALFQRIVKVHRVTRFSKKVNGKSWGIPPPPWETFKNSVVQGGVGVFKVLWRALRRCPSSLDTSTVGIPTKIVFLAFCLVLFFSVFVDYENDACTNEYVFKPIKNVGQRIFRNFLTYFCNSRVVFILENHIFGQTRYDQYFSVFSVYSGVLVFKH